MELDIDQGTAIGTLLAAFDGSHGLTVDIAKVFAHGRKKHPGPPDVFRAQIEHAVNHEQLRELGVLRETESGCLHAAHTIARLILAIAKTIENHNKQAARSGRRGLI